MKLRIKLIMWAFLLLSTYCSMGQNPNGTDQNKSSTKTDVFILATLYRNHSTTPVYDHNVLRQIITAIQPDVFVLDATPKELKDKKVHASKMEYPEVIFPLIQSNKHKSYPAEPDEPIFSEIVNATIKAMNDFEANTPDASKMLDQFSETLLQTLRVSWKTPADVNSAVTDKVMAGKRSLQGKLIGKVFADGSDFWNTNIANVTLRAVKENPGKKILVLIGVENCTMVRDLLLKQETIHLVNMEEWLNAQKF